jgi:L-methionine (R)-S-oxide reductase
MAEVTLDLRGMPKDEAYERLNVQIDAVLDGIDDEIATMSTISSLVHHAFSHLWTGFYRQTEPGRLTVGPYQGTLGCLEITFGRGVCGTAASERRTVIVPDVGKFPGHITCDSRAVSEIVVPVFGRRSELLGVFDVDSEQAGRFDEADARGLEQILQRFGRLEGVRTAGGHGQS